MLGLMSVVDAKIPRRGNVAHSYSAESVLSKQFRDWDNTTSVPSWKYLSANENNYAIDVKLVIIKNRLLVCTTTIHLTDLHNRHLGCVELVDWVLHWLLTSVCVSIFFAEKHCSKKTAQLSLDRCNWNLFKRWADFLFYTSRWISVVTAWISSANCPLAAFYRRPWRWECWWASEERTPSPPDNLNSKSDCNSSKHF